MELSSTTKWKQHSQQLRFLKRTGGSSKREKDLGSGDKDYFLDNRRKERGPSGRYDQVFQEAGGVFIKASWQQDYPWKAGRSNIKHKINQLFK